MEKSMVRWALVGFAAAAMELVACSEDVTTVNPGSDGGETGGASSGGGSSTGGRSTGGTVSRGGGGANASGGAAGRGGAAGSGNGGASGASGGGNGGASGADAGTGGADAGTGGADAGTGGTGTGGAGTGGTGTGGAGTGGTGTGGSGVGGTDGGDGGPVCLTDPDHGALGSKTAPDALQTVNSIRWALPLESGAVADQLSIGLYDTFGVFSGGLVTGTFPITGDELNFETCGLCVLIYENVDSGGQYRGSYLATGGSVTLTSVAGSLTGTLTNVTFEHVNIDLSTFHSTPDPDGCVSHVTSLTFNVPIQIQ